MSHVVYVVLHKWTESEQGSTNHLVMSRWIHPYFYVESMYATPALYKMHFNTFYVIT